MFLQQQNEDAILNILKQMTTHSFLREIKYENIDSIEITKLLTNVKLCVMKNDNMTTVCLSPNVSQLTKLLQECDFSKDMIHLIFEFHGSFLRCDICYQHLDFDQSCVECKQKCSNCHKKYNSLPNFESCVECKKMCHINCENLDGWQFSTQHSVCPNCSHLYFLCPCCKNIKDIANINFYCENCDEIFCHCTNSHLPPECEEICQEKWFKCVKCKQNCYNDELFYRCLLCFNQQHDRCLRRYQTNICYDCKHSNKRKKY